MWQTEYLMNDLNVKNGEPFKITCQMDEKDYFMLTNMLDPRIKYIAFGLTDEDYIKIMKN